MKRKAYICGKTEHEKENVYNWKTENDKERVYQ